MYPDVSCVYPSEYCILYVSCVFCAYPVRASAKPCCLVTPTGTCNYVQANYKPGDASTMWTALKCIEPHHRPSRVRCSTMGASVANDDPNGTKLPSAKLQ